mmetsp:Transcript_102588/g.319682  ORF Transcript_102588/g.319682 Transcript_102588/m.319682 type:complete len:347 (-) Transcript_102588:27-1067(-)
MLDELCIRVRHLPGAGERPRQDLHAVGRVRRSLHHGQILQLAGVLRHRHPDLGKPHLRLPEGVWCGDRPENGQLEGHALRVGLRRLCRLWVLGHGEDPPGQAEETSAAGRFCGGGGRGGRGKGQEGALPNSEDPSGLWERAFQLGTASRHQHGVHSAEGQPLGDPALGQRERELRALRAPAGRAAPALAVEPLEPLLRLQPLHGRVLLHGEPRRRLAGPDAGGRPRGERGPGLANRDDHQAVFHNPPRHRGRIQHAVAVLGRRSLREHAGQGGALSGSREGLVLGHGLLHRAPQYRHLHGGDEPDEGGHGRRRRRPHLGVLRRVGQRLRRPPCGVQRGVRRQFLLG